MTVETICLRIYRISAWISDSGLVEVLSRLRGSVRWDIVKQLKNSRTALRTRQVVQPGLRRIPIVRVVFASLWR